MALYNGFTTKFYGKCDGEVVNSGFILTDIQLIKQDLLNHIFTLKGERVMQPTFGSTIPDLLFEPLDEQIISLVEDELTRIISADPRVILLDLKTSADYDNHTIQAGILLQYIELNVVDNLSLNIEFQ